MRISDWSSDVCSSDLAGTASRRVRHHAGRRVNGADAGRSPATAPGSRLSGRLAAGTPAATISTHPTGNIMARILIVDDAPSQLMGIRRIVEKLGHEALTAEDGAAGVEAAKRELPDLILMDVVMPNLNGFQATRSITR